MEIKMKTSIVSKKGWVVIPKEVREHHGLKQGDRVQVIDCGDMISIVPVSKDPVKQARGIAKGKTSLIKSLLESRREDEKREK
jgi:AbrB family looped-hinge helix DNA binding protein